MLTPRALLHLLDGYKAREDAQWRREATMTAHLLNISGKSTRSRVTADTLLGTAAAPPAPSTGATFDDEEDVAPDSGIDIAAALTALFHGKDVRKPPSPEPHGADRR